MDKTDSKSNKTKSELDAETKFGVFTIAKAKYVEKNIEEDLDFNEDYEFIEESKERCDYEIKPPQWKPCNEFDCAETTR